MISNLILQNFRIFDGVNLEFDDSPSVIFCGGNGQGKTSLLESIYFLGNLRSFRTQNIKEMRKMGKNFFRLEGKVEKHKGFHYTLETRGTDKVSPSSSSPVFTKELFIDHAPIYKASDFTGRLSIVAFLPEDPDILTGSSLVRRRFFDIFCATIDREYMGMLQSYTQALRSRNFLLKKGRPDPAILASYDMILAKNGSRILEKRLHYTLLLEEKVREILKEIRQELSDFTILYRHHKEGENVESYRQKLQQDLNKDLLKTYTTFGPHLDDFDISGNGKSLKLYGSRGQLRMTSFAMKMGIFSLIHGGEKESGNSSIIALVDDVLGDLDTNAKESFFNRVAGQSQVFYTFTEIPREKDLSGSRIFTVKDGNVSF